MGKFSCLFIYLYKLIYHVLSVHLHSETCFSMYSNNCISLPNHMGKKKTNKQPKYMDVYWDCIFFLHNSLLGLDITSPCLLALLSCFSPQLVSKLLPLLFLSLITFDFITCTTMQRVGSSQLIRHLTKWSMTLL